MTFRATAHVKTQAAGVEAFCKEYICIADRFYTSSFQYVLSFSEKNDLHMYYGIN